MAKNILARTKFDPDMDYDDLSEVFTMASGCKVWCERDGKYMNIVTSGNPDEVASGIMDKASSIIEDVIFEAIAFELSGMGKWERNAKMN